MSSPVSDPTTGPGAGPAAGPATSPIRVAHLLEQCWHRVPGGTAVAAVGLARALHARADVEVTGFRARHRAGPPDHLDAGVPTVASRLPRSVLYESWHRLRRPVVDRLVGHPDLVHATGGAVPATGLPLVATIHDLAWRHHPEVATKRGHRMFEAWLSDARRADRVVCPSEATRLDLLRAGFADNQVVVVPLGADPVAAAPDRAAELRARHGLDGPVVLWVGTVEPRKNLPVLASALASLDLDGLTLVVVGPTGWREDLAAAIAPLGDRVVVTGPVDEATKHAWFDAADVFCFPSLLEGFGLPVLEAMGHGTPVVTSAGTATEEVLGDAGLTVDPADVDGLAGAVRRVLGDSNLAERLGAAGRLRAATMTWDATAEATVRVYREVLHQ